MAQSDIYTEYTPSGEVAKGRPELVPDSKYVENKFPGNHSAVFGSWYDRKEGKWGFACCHCVHLKSYCTGKFQQTMPAALTAATKRRDRKRALPTAAKAPEDA